MWAIVLISSSLPAKNINRAALDEFTVAPLHAPPTTNKKATL